MGTFNLNINYKDLRHQKLKLGYLIEETEDIMDNTHMEGLMTLIDTIQDQALRYRDNTQAGVYGAIEACDISDVAERLNKKLTVDQLITVWDQYDDAAIDDPTSNWTEVVEQLIYNLQN